MTWNWKYHFLNIHSLEKLRFEFCIWNTTSDLRNSVIRFIHSNIVLSVITSFLNLIIEVISVFSVRAICRLCGEIFNPSPIFESCRLIIYWDAVVKVRLRALIRILTSCQQPMRGLYLKSEPIRAKVTPWQRCINQPDVRMAEWLPLCPWPRPPLLTSHHGGWAHGHRGHGCSQYPEPGPRSGGGCGHKSSRSLHNLDEKN